GSRSSKSKTPQNIGQIFNRAERSLFIIHYLKRRWSYRFTQWIRRSCERKPPGKNVLGVRRRNRPCYSTRNCAGFTCARGLASAHQCDLRCAEQSSCSGGDSFRRRDGGDLRLGGVHGRTNPPFALASSTAVDGTAPPAGVLPGEHRRR